MNILFELQYPHAIRGSITQPLRSFKVTSAPHLSELTELLEGHWDLHDLNFHVSLDHALSIWQSLFTTEMKKLQEGGVPQWTEMNFASINQLLDLWLKVVKKMEFYRLEGSFRRILFHPLGLYSVYSFGNLRSIHLLSEIQKYFTFEDGITLQELKQEEQASIFKDVSLKIARHVLLQLKSQMYLPGKDLMIRLLKLYGFKYNFKVSFSENYQEALKDKQVTSQQSRQASIILFTLKIAISLQTLEGVCDYLNYLKCILLDRTSGVLSADYDLWTLLYETCLRMVSRHEWCIQNSLMQIDQIMTTPLTDQEFQSFLLKHMSEEKLSLSSINFYIKNCRREQKEQLKSLVLLKIDDLLSKKFWTSVEDIYEYFENQLQGEEKKTQMKKMLEKMLHLPYQEVSQNELYNVQYGVSFLIENCLKYFEQELILLGKSLVLQMLKICHKCIIQKQITPSLIICFKLFNMFMGTVYLEIDHENWTVNHLEDILELTKTFSELGFVSSKAALKLLYHFLSQSDDPTYWEKYFQILAEHYFIGGYDDNSDLQIIHSHEEHKEIIAAKILIKFSQLAACQLTENRQLQTFIQEKNTKQFKESWFAVRGQRDNCLLQGVQNICLIFSSHLSMQSLQFSLNLVSPFTELTSWQVEEDEPSLLSLICQEIPIEILKFVFKELSSEESIDCKVLQRIPPIFWSRFWSDKNNIAKGLSSCELDMVDLEELQKLRRLQFVMDLANCVFDKLNEHSQKNIKEIKMIYEGGVRLASQVLNKICHLFLEGTALTLLHKVQKLSYDEAKSLSLCSEDNSLLAETFIASNSFLSTASLFNEIGRVNESNKVMEFKKALLPCFPQFTSSSNERQEVILKQFQIISSIESTWEDHLTDNQIVFTSKEWNSKMSALIDELKVCLKRQKEDAKDSFKALTEKLNQHIRDLLAKLVLPTLLTQLLLKDSKTTNKISIGLMRSSMELIYIMNSDYEEHLITLVERLEDNLKENGKGWTIQTTQIICLLELMIDLIFSGIRIRSYHLYRVIRYYQKATGQSPTLFNAIIAGYIKLCFDEFITNYKTPNPLTELSCHKKLLTASHLKLNRQQLKMSTVEAACMLSMFINLFCRLNFPSLGAGVEKIFGEQEGKAIYLDYLISLSRKIEEEVTSIGGREQQILKIDVYGNLSIITKGSFPERLLNKLISLAKHLLKVKIDIKGVNKLPINILAEKLAVQPLSLSLEQFEDQCQAISLGALSVYQRIQKYVNSNLHLLNLYFISDKSFTQNIDLNLKLLTQNKKFLQEEKREIMKNGYKSLNIEVNPLISNVIAGLISKIQIFHSLCLKEKDYIEKLYATFKILSICCLNKPQVIPFVLEKRVKIEAKQQSFIDFLLQTLKLCLPLFCEFSILFAKCNWGFKEVAPGEFIPLNFMFQVQLKEKLISLLEKQLSKGKSEYIFLAKAVTFIQNHFVKSRLKAYRFVKIHNDSYENLLKESDRQFNINLVNAFQVHLRKHDLTSFSCKNVFEMLELALQNCNINSTNLDIKKYQIEEELYRTFQPQDLKSCKEGLTEKKSWRQNGTNKSLEQTNLKKGRLLFQSVLEISGKLTQLMPTIHQLTNIQSKKTRLTALQEEIIGVSESKLLGLNWCEDESQNEINNTIVQRFKIFNEQIQSKEFMKDLAAFPSKNGIDLVDKSIILLNQGNQENCFADSDIIEQNYNTESNMSSDAVIESERENIPQSSCEQLIKFSIKAIEESQELPPIPSLKNSDSIVYSELEIGQGEDGSMKLCGEDLDSYRDIYHSQREQITKNSILDLIEDYTLNPEAIKQIALKIKFLPVTQLFKIFSQQSGEIAFVLEAELRSRGVSVPCKEPISAYEQFFIDEGKLFEKLKGRQCDDKEIVISQLSSNFIKEWILLIMRLTGEGKFFDSKRISSFLRKVCLNKENILHLLIQSMKILSTRNDIFQSSFDLSFSKYKSPEWYKHILIDHIFGSLIQQRTALSIFFYGWWSPLTMSLASEFNKEMDSVRVIEIILEILVSSPEKTSSFLKNVLDYIGCLNKTSKFIFPYFQIQDSIPLPSSLAKTLSNRLRFYEQSFSDNSKLLMLFNVMNYLELSTFKEFLKIELTKTAEIINKVCEKEDQVLQHFQRLYGHEEGVQLERKAEIYWKLRKNKNLEDRNAELVLSRKILTDVTVKVLEVIKENCFSLYYRREESELKEELVYLHRKFTQARHYNQKYVLEQEFKEKQKRFLLWKRNLLNLIIVEDISPAIDEISGPFIAQLSKSIALMTDLHSIFQKIKDRTPILFGICSQLYKIMLAFDLAKKEHQATFHSMSNLKTLPSINSTRQASAVRRRSSLAHHRTSGFNMAIFDIGSVLKKCAQLLPSDALGFTPSDPLMGSHAKNASTETKLLYLKTENKFGEKTIEITRESVWADTFPHLNENFGQHDIKINIKGEMGLDYGGVTRQWVNMIIKEITDPKLGLFELNVNELAFQPSKISYLVPNHLQIFYRLGIFVGKALKEGWLLELNFTKSFLKHMLGATLYVQDLEDIDPDTARSLMWILKNYIGEDLGLNFTYEEEVLQHKRIIELVPGGAEVPVTEANKKEYVKKLAYTKMTENIREQSLSFMSGVEEVIPTTMLRLLNYKEVGKFLSGCVTIDIDQMQKYAKYEGYNEDDPNVKWFWKALKQKNEEEKAEFLFFLTGSYRVPYSGFKDNPVTVNKMPGCKDYLPVAHTCFSIIDLPQYTSEETLSKMLTCAIKEGKGFTVS